MGEKAKILIYDLEVSTARVETEVYGLKIYNKYHNHRDITRDYTILGAAWKWLGDEHTRCISVSPRNVFHDEAIVRKMHELATEAHVLVGHNLERFDMRKINARFLYYGLPPIGKKPTVDTLKLARKHFDLLSNALEYLARYLKLDIEKDTSPNWVAILKGCPVALAYMREYNKRDVDVTEQVFLRLRGWNEAVLPVAAIEDRKDIEGIPISCCPNCGSDDIIKDGFKYRMYGKFQRYRCKNCSNLFHGQRFPRGKVR